MPCCVLGRGQQARLGTGRGSRLAAPGLCVHLVGFPLTSPGAHGSVGLLRNWQTALCRWPAGSLSRQPGPGAPQGQRADRRGEGRAGRGAWPSVGAWLGPGLWEGGQGKSGGGCWGDACSGFRPSGEAPTAPPGCHVNGGSEQRASSGLGSNPQPPRPTGRCAPGRPGLTARFLARKAPGSSGPPSPPWAWA